MTTFLAHFLLYVTDQISSFSLSSALSIWNSVRVFFFFSLIKVLKLTLKKCYSSPSPQIIDKINDIKKYSLVATLIECFDDVLFVCLCLCTSAVARWKIPLLPVKPLRSTRISRRLIGLLTFWSIHQKAHPHPNHVVVDYGLRFKLALLSSRSESPSLFIHSTETQKCLVCTASIFFFFFFYSTGT